MTNEKLPERVWLTVFTDDREPHFTMLEWRSPVVRNTQPGDYVATRPHYKLEYRPVPPASAALVVDNTPIDMVLFCPRCGTQHIDAPEDETSFRHRMEAWSLNAEWQDRTPTRWTNPPHKSHLCHNCFAVWRPADVPTNGVAQIKTRGKEDNTWTNSAAVPAAATAAPQDRFCGFCRKSDQEVKTLIQAAIGYICDECVAICAGIIERKPDCRPCGTVG